MDKIMRYRFDFIIESYLKKDIEILRNSFILNMKQNAIYGRTTLEKVINIDVNTNDGDLRISFDVESDSEKSLLGRAIHGGLGKALGKGRVKAD